MFSGPGPVSRKSRELFGPEKPFVKLRPAYSLKLVFSYVVKGIKIKITAKFRASRRLRFEDTKRIMSPEIRPKSFGTFEKQAPGREIIRDTWTSQFPCPDSPCSLSRTKLGETIVRKLLASMFAFISRGRFANSFELNLKFKYLTFHGLLYWDVEKNCQHGTTNL